MKRSKSSLEQLLFFLGFLFALLAFFQCTTPQEEDQETTEFGLLDEVEKNEDNSFESLDDSDELDQDLDDSEIDPDEVLSGIDSDDELPLEKDSFENISVDSFEEPEAESIEAENNSLEPENNIAPEDGFTPEYEHEILTYNIEKGDWLSKISGRVYGDIHKWNIIAKANPQLTDPNKIFPGQKILIPIIGEEAIKFSETYKKTLGQTESQAPAFASNKNNSIKTQKSFLKVLNSASRTKNNMPDSPLAKTIALKKQGNTISFSNTKGLVSHLFTMIRTCSKAQV